MRRLIVECIYRLLPSAWIHHIKRCYYPGVVKRFPAHRWPPHTVARQLVRAGDTVVDLGANIGYVSVLLSRWVGSKGKVFSFEPVPDTYDFLQRNVRSLKTNVIQTVELAASDRSESSVIQIPVSGAGSENYYEASLESQEGGANDRFREVTVQCAQLDDVVLPNIDGLQLIKIDVEGHELHALRGAKKILSRFEPALIIEIQGDLDEAGATGARVVEFLKEFGYEVYIFINGSLKLRERGQSDVDYYFLKQQHLALLTDVMPSGSGES